MTFSVVCAEAMASKEAALVLDCGDEAQKVHFWIYPAKKNRGPLTYGPNSDEEWSQIIIHQEVNGPTNGEEWSEHTCNDRH